MRTDTERLDFIIENNLRIERWSTSPEHQLYQVIDDVEDDVVGESINAREAIDQAMLDSEFFA